jgi:transposase
MKQLLHIFFMTLSLTLAAFPVSNAYGTDEATVNKMLKQFQSKGILNEEQAAEARKKLKEISPEQWSQIKAQAQQMKKEGRVPAQQTSNNVDAAAGLIDTDSPEFQDTMKKMKGILETP